MSQIEFMKRLSLVFLLAVIAVSCFCSCDFIRTIAGRPTSDQIGQLRVSEKQRLEEQSARHEADSLAKAVADAYDAFLAEGMKIRKLSEIPGLDSQKIEKGLYLAMGAFSMESNAHKMESKVTARGYEALCISYTNGFVLVAAIPSPNYSELRDGYLKIKNEQFFPSDAWILECE